MSIKRVFIGLLPFFLFFSFNVYAADYVWFFNYDDSISGSSPSSLCAQYAPSSYNPFQSAGYKYHSYSGYFHNSTQYNCVVKWFFIDKDGLENIYPVTSNIIRSGDSCPANTVYNSSNGVCEPPPDLCKDKKDQPTSFVISNLTDSGLGPIEHACKQSCRVLLGTSSCAPSAAGATDWKCWGVGVFTGDACVAGDAPEGGNPPTDPTDPTAPPPDCGPKHTWSGTTCVLTDPGDGGDGDGDGDSGDGDGDSGDGDGDGDSGDGDGEEEKPEKSSVSGLACNAVLDCKGDAIQCAILKSKKDSNCAWDYSKSEGKIESEISKAEYQLQKDSRDVGGFFRSSLNAGRWLPSSCPADLTANLTTGSISLSMQPMCDLASGISPVIVALSCLFFAIYVGRAFGGG